MNIHELIKSAERAKLAYKQPHEVPHRFITSTPASRQDCQAYFWREQKNVYITFRGTLNKNDMMANIDARFYNLKNGIKIHHGFYKQFTSVEKCLMDCLDVNSDASDVYVTGHSLGGSIGNIASVHLAEIYPHLKFTCHTFGSPRVGNQEFTRWFLTHVKEHVRVVNKFDPVTILPPWLHMDDIRLELCGEESQWYNLYEHDIDVYISRLKRNLPL